MDDDILIKCMMLRSQWEEDEKRLTRFPPFYLTGCGIVSATAAATSSSSSWMDRWTGREAFTLF